MKLRPLQDRIIVRRQESDKVSEGGIIIPEAAREKTLQGKVLAVGNGKQVDGHIRPMEVQVDDEVLFGKYAGNELEIDGEQLLILREDDVLGVVGTS
ncbi:MAG: co-chaperone GroES [Planctomycetota bacterium]|jgi:chaperonin GroES